MVNEATEKSKESVYVYCADVAKDILAKEKNIELCCVIATQRICSTPEEIDFFYGVTPALAYTCPECDNIGFTDDDQTIICKHCTSYMVNRTRTEQVGVEL